MYMCQAQGYAEALRDGCKRLPALPRAGQHLTQGGFGFGFRVGFEREGFGDQGLGIRAACSNSGRSGKPVAKGIRMFLQEFP